MNEFKTTSALKERSLDGIYLRGKIDGEWVARCLTDLVWEDVEAWLKDKSTLNEHNEFLLNVIKHLHERLRAVGDYLHVIEHVAESENGKDS
jgi:hypothetical protein